MDGANNVFQGQEGTGDAFVYKGMDDKSLALVDKIFNLSGRAPKKASTTSGATGKETKKQELKRDFHYKWASEMAPRLNSLENIGVQFATKGVDVVNDPTAGEPYVVYNKAMGELQDDKNLQDQLGKLYDETNSLLNKGDKKFDQESVKEFENYYNRNWSAIKSDLEKGVPPPRINEDTTYNDVEFINKLTNAIPLSQTSSKGDYQGKILVTEVAERQRGAIDNLVEVTYTNDKGMQDAHKLLFNNLSASKQAGYQEEAKKTGKDPILLFTQDVKYDQARGKTVNETLSSKDKDIYYWQSGEGKALVKKRATDIDNILNGGGVTNFQGNPVTPEERRKAEKGLAGIFIGRELQGVQINSIEIKDGIVYAHGTTTSKNLFGSGAPQVVPQTIPVLNLNLGKDRSAQAINELMNNNGFEKISNDYIEQSIGGTGATISVKPTKKAAKTNNSIPKTKAEETQLSILQKD